MSDGWGGPSWARTRRVVTVEAQRWGETDPEVDFVESQAGNDRGAGALETVESGMRELGATGFAWAWDGWKA